MFAPSHNLNRKEIESVELTSKYSYFLNNICIIIFLLTSRTCVCRPGEKFSAYPTTDVKLGTSGVGTQTGAGLTATIV